MSRLRDARVGTSPTSWPRRRVGAALAAVALVTLAACGGSSSTQTSDSLSEPADTSGAATTDASTDTDDVADTTVASSEPGNGSEEAERGGTFTFGAVAAPPTVNPALGDPAFNPIYQWAYEPLVILDPDGSFSPGLATEFGYADDENKVYEITLREGVLFSDGSELTADGVKAYLEYLQQQATSPGLLVQSIESIEVLSPLELRLNLNRSDPGYNFYFAQAFGAGNVISPAALEDPEMLNTASAGAGQYMVDPAESVANNRYTYVPNPNYYDQDAIQFDKVVVQIVANSSSMIQAMRAGDIQAAQGDATTIAAAEAAGLDVVSAPQALTGLNLFDRGGALSEPLANPVVRKALNLAVDRAAIAEGLYGDAELALAQYALPGTPGYIEALEDEYAYDPDEARALLAEAGYPDGFDLPALSVPLVGLDKMVEAIGGYLSDVGVNLEITTVPTVNEYITSMLGGEFPTGAIGYGLYNANSLYAGFVAPAGPFNPFQTVDPDLDQLYAAYFATPTDSAGDLEQAINRHLVESGWTIPVVGAPLPFYVAEGFTGIEATTQNAAVPHFTELRRSS